MHARSTVPSTTGRILSSSFELRRIVLRVREAASAIRNQRALGHKRFEVSSPCSLRTGVLVSPCLVGLPRSCERGAAEVFALSFSKATRVFARTKLAARYGGKPCEGNATEARTRIFGERVDAMFIPSAWAGGRVHGSGGLDMFQLLGCSKE